MKHLNTIFLVIVTLIAIFITAGSFVAKVSLPGQIFRLLLLPVTLYLIVRLVTHLTSRASAVSTENNWIKLVTLYSLIVTCAFLFAGFSGSSTKQQFLTSLFFTPLAIYFFAASWPQRKLVAPGKQYQPAISIVRETVDEDKRDFLKMIGAAGISVLLVNLFSRKTMDYLPFINTSRQKPSNDQEEATETTPTQSPTAGFSISQVDDSEIAYFGFTNSKGQWYIMREESGNTYRYTRGDRDFTSNWKARANLKYDYFENVF